MTLIVLACVFGALFGYCVIALVIGILDAPFGYEDEEGFHYGKDGDPKVGCRMVGGGVQISMAEMKSHRSQ